MQCCNYTATESFQIILLILIDLSDELFPFLLFYPWLVASEKAECASRGVLQRKERRCSSATLRVIPDGVG